jgi:C1A family cysteine protease
MYGAVSAPASVDWSTNSNVVTPVKNQGSCGSCWAFSATGAIEGAYGIKNNKQISHSEQQLVDCAGLRAGYGNMGCNGGLMDNAFTYGQDYVLQTESAYPYNAVGGTCAVTDKKGSAHSVVSFVDVTPNSEAALTAAVAQQPVSIAIQANQIGFQAYSSGVFNGNCGTNLDHGVLLVGYGTDSASGLNYWKVKNSWGATWGEAGYIRIARNDATGPGLCGVQMQPSYPNV